MSKASNQNNNASFSFQLANNNIKTQFIKNVFSSVAKHYDLMNNIMSFGIHNLWKDEFCDHFFNLNGSLLDVAGGTGDIAFRFYRKAKKYNANPHITICDISYDMLEQGRNKAIDTNLLENIEYINCDAESLPFLDNSFDNFAIAFGIRNISNILISLKEAYRVLKPGGQFVCLEFSKVQNSFVSKLYDLYSFNFIPLIGKFITGDKKAYQYLIESIRVFPDQKNFCQMIEQVGFQNVKFRNLSFGVVAIHSAYKL